VAIETQCPACSRKLRVPENLLGKTVRCPNCKQTFTASEAGDEPAETAVTSKPVPSSRRGDYQEAPPRRKRNEEDEILEAPIPDEEPPEEEYDEEEAERRRRRRRKARRREEAASAVMGPAIALMVVGGLSLVLYAVDLILRLMGFAMFGAAAMGGGAGGNDAAGMAGYAVGSVIGMVIAFCWSGTVLGGGIQMYRLSNHGQAMTAAIVAMVPCSLCCLLGIPFGIWALVVLNKPEVKDAFR
jgi:predicted Zn finger-like uncharacterized protein